MYEELKKLLYQRDFDELERRLSDSHWDRSHEAPYESLLRIASHNENGEDLVRWLLSNGFKATPHIVMSAIELDGSASKIRLLMENLEEKDRNFRDYGGDNFVVAAVTGGITTYLMMEGFEDHARDAEVDRSCAVIEALLDRGVDINNQNLAGETALHYCTMTSNPFNYIPQLAFAKILMAYGANPRIRDNQSKEPIDYAKVIELTAVLA
jgi:ankyrin repeat protein